MLFQINKKAKPKYTGVVSNILFLFSFWALKIQKIMKKNYANFDLEQIIKFVIIFLSNYSDFREHKGKIIFLLYFVYFCFILIILI